MLSQQPALPREIAGVTLPDGSLAQKAVDLAFRVSPAVVRTHVLRTFVFGALVGQAQNLRYDEELYFLASVRTTWGLWPGSGALNASKWSEPMRPTLS